VIAVAPNNGSDAKTRIEVLTEEVSASRLNLWSQCRLKFYFRYVAQIKRPPTPALIVGKTLHGVLQSWSYARWRGDATFKDRVKEVFDQRWVEEQQEGGIDWDGKEDKEKEIAFNLLELYLKETPIPDSERPRGVEVMLEADLGKHGLPRLIGVLDLVRGNGVIVDYKSAKQNTDPARIAHQTEIQTTCYGVLFRDATGQKEAGYEIHSLVKTKSPRLVVTSLPPSTAKQQTRLFRIMESYMDGLDRQDFIPSPNIQCASCQYFNECRRWS
jgi:hypothetical protein